MRRNGQHGLIGQTHLRLDSIPDLAALEKSAERLAQAYPLLNAKTRRNPLNFLVAWHPEKRGTGLLPVNLWFEKGACVPEGRHAMEIPSEEDWVDHVLNQPLGFRDGLRNLHIDLILLRTGESLLVLTWTHLLFDGKGAEFLVNALVNPPPPEAEAATPAPLPAPRHPLWRLRELLREATPVVERFSDLTKNRYSSLGGPRPRPGRLRFQMITFDRESTSRIQARMEAAVGPLFSIGFYLACAMRAHRAAFLKRGEDPERYVVSIPVQVRKKGRGGTPFQNCVTILFFALEREALGSIESAAACAQQQFEEMTRARLDRSFSAVLELMSVIPSGLYLRFLSAQFGGEITSFFHSFTGDFSAGLKSVFGASVRNAYHIPSVSAPPGSGLFFGLFNGRLNATFSWREGSVTSAEADSVLATVRADLLGDQPSILPQTNVTECMPT